MSSALLPSTGMEATTKYHHTSMDKGGTVSVLSSTYPYHSPVNPTGVAGFQPTGGAFITMPVSPKVVKPEPLKTDQQYSTQYSVSNLVAASIHTDNGRNVPKFTAAPVLHAVSYCVFLSLFLSSQSQKRIFGEKKKKINLFKTNFKTNLIIQIGPKPMMALLKQQQTMQPLGNALHQQASVTSYQPSLALALLSTDNEVVTLKPQQGAQFLGATPAQPRMYSGFSAQVAGTVDLNINTIILFSSFKSFPLIVKYI